ncbi:hypothetical protein DRN34_05565 [Thermococci archaeon]|nr:MAG: hypothetical protein DRN34_05565 [Thermococci archaeon]
MRIKLFSRYPLEFLGWVEPDKLEEGYIDVTAEEEPKDINGDPMIYEVHFNEANNQWYAVVII